MKLTIYTGLCCTLLLFASCSDTNKKDNTTNSPDTAVLKTDTANTLNANPINDTTIKEKSR
jgi:hypothetical protein